MAETRGRRPRFFGLVNGKSTPAPEQSSLPIALQHETVRWGPFLLPAQEAQQHFFAAGATGSGKTTLLLLLLSSLLKRQSRGSDVRFIANDPKSELIPRLAAMQLDAPLIIANPFDRRSRYWNMSVDIDEPRVALEVSYVLMPETHESQPFFQNAGRHIVYGVLLSYMQRKLTWKFADVLRALQSPKRLRRVLLACPYTRNLVSLYFSEVKALSHVLSTVATKMVAYEHVAAAWETTQHSFSLKEWASESSFLLLGNTETSRHAVDAINRCILKRASDLLLAQPDSGSRQSYMLIDEASDMGRIDGLVPLAKKGRSKGVSLILAFQSIAGLRDKNVYGPEQTADLLGQFGNRFFGRLECHETAEWASKLVGDQEVIQTTFSHTRGSESTTNESEHYATKNAVLPAEFMALPACTKENGLTAWYLNRCHDGVIRAKLNGERLFERQVAAPMEGVPSFVPRSPECQLLRPWSREEASYFAPVFKRASARPAASQRFEGVDFQAIDAALNPDFE